VITWAGLTVLGFKSTGKRSLTEPREHTTKGLLIDYIINERSIDNVKSSNNMISH
jgi:hypothetical protein